MTQLYRKRVLAATIETTPGTAVSLLAADAAFNAYNIVIQQETEFETREGQGGFANLASVAGARRGRITFSHAVEWDSTITEPLWADTFLPACGWVKSGDTFTPRTEVPGANVKTLTMAVYEDGVLKRMRGCVGTFTLTMPAGRMAFLNFDFIGIWDNTSDASILSPTYPTVPALRFVNTVTWTGIGSAMCVEQLTLNSGNTMRLIECGNVDGYRQGLITARNITLTANPESMTTTTPARYTALFANSEASLSGTIAATAANVIVTAPRAQLLDIKEGNREGMNVDEMTFQACRNTSIDTEASIQFSVT